MFIVFWLIVTLPLFFLDKSAWKSIRWSTDEVTGWLSYKSGEYLLEEEEVDLSYILSLLLLLLLLLYPCLSRGLWL